MVGSRSVAVRVVAREPEPVGSRQPRPARRDAAARGLKSSAQPTARPSSAVRRSTRPPLASARCRTASVRQATGKPGRSTWGIPTPKGTVMPRSHSRRTGAAASVLIVVALGLSACGASGSGHVAMRRAEKPAETAKPASVQRHASPSTTPSTTAAPDPIAAPDASDTPDETHDVATEEAARRVTVTNLVPNDFPAGWQAEASNDPGDDNAYATCAGDRLDLNEHTVAK